MLVLAGIVFYFAFNWSGLHRFARIGLVVLPLIAATAVAARHAGRGLAGQAALGAATVLVGVLLAVIGQIYQTGADSELLFAGWAVLALPWVILAGAPWLWLFWLLLVNVALALYLTGRASVWAAFFLSDGLFWTPLLFNALALVAWEALSPRVPAFRVAYAPRLIVLFAASAATALGVSWVWLDDLRAWHVLRWTPLFYSAWVAATVFYYRLCRRDLVPLVLVALSLIVVLSAGLIHFMFSAYRFGSGGFLFIGLAVAAMSALATLFLRHTARQWAKAGGEGHD